MKTNRKTRDTSKNKKANARNMRSERKEMLSNDDSENNCETANFKMTALETKRMEIQEKPGQTNREDESATCESSSRATSRRARHQSPTKSSS
jgi:hypothetical protein